VNAAGQTKVTLTFPTVPGSYSLSVSANNTITDWIVLPLETEPFLVVSEEEYSAKWAGQYIPKLLSCYRSVECNGRSVRVKEEYGSTIGSHIYDSSIVIMRHLQEHFDNTFGTAHAAPATVGVDSAAIATVRTPFTILELGAGCGLAGIWCAQMLSDRLSLERPGDGSEARGEVGEEERAVQAPEKLSVDADACEPGNDREDDAQRCRYQVHLTDKGNQLPLLTQNVQQATTTCPLHPAVHTLCAELDWSSAAQITAYIVSLAGAPVNLIIAGDVFYDREIAQLFASLVRRVSTPGVTRVLVAQKLRKNADNIAVALIGEQEIREAFGYEDIVLVRAEADVLLWSMLAC
jgi:hypothetical protein